MKKGTCAVYGEDKWVESYCVAISRVNSTNTDTKTALGEGRIYQGAHSLSLRALVRLIEKIERGTQPPKKREKREKREKTA